MSLGKQYSESEVIDDLQALAEELGHSPSKQECNESDITPTEIVYRTRFGTWNKAKEEAGLDVQESFETPVEITRVDILEQINMLEGRLGETPTSIDFQSAEDTASIATVYERFESWSDALEEADKELHQPRDGEGVTTDSVSSHVRNRVLERDSHSCVRCGVSQVLSQALHVDHIRKVSEGGSDEMENLRVLCRTCHALRHSSDRCFGTLQAQVDGWFVSVARVESRIAR